MTTDKKIGFKHRIPAVAFVEALREYLHNDNYIEPDRITELLAGYFSGDYVRHGAMLHIKACLNNPNVTEFLIENKVALREVVANQQEAAHICFALLCALYSFCYDISVELAKHFRLQDVVSKELLSKSISNKYGLNENARRSMERFIAFCDDAGIIKRQKSLYEMANILKPSNQVTINLWKLVYAINEPLADVENNDDLPFEPFFRYLNLF